ncbi:uncharacterized protein TNCT_738241 [Trichonephila clavata]|uniref:DUF7041 domain-containing protein n=1 Tax=Trichonephila clavata TaxID=2740835 RepID=A0A8X6GJX1_TRICU|nr:uncharacterized protein TNCT_738241 [Trichonephila clavata]
MEDISAVKIPAFVSSEPALWFAMLKSTFELAVLEPIIDKRTKYNYCVAHLSPEAAMAVRGVILSPGSTNPCSKLIEDVISRWDESKSQKPILHGNKKKTTKFRGCKLKSKCADSFLDFYIIMFNQSFQVFNPLELKKR